MLVTGFMCFDLDVKFVEKLPYFRMCSTTFIISILN